MASFRSTLIFLLLCRQITGDTTKNVHKHSNDLYSSSITGLLKLLEMEQDFIENIRVYTNKLAEKVKNLQAYIDSVYYKVNESLEDREKYVSNPLNAFSLVRRTHQDMPKWHNYSQQIVGLEELYALEEILSKAPDEKDLEYSLEKMDQLEKTYDLEATDLARGRLHNKEHNITLSIRDCVVLGEHKLKNEDYKRASMWFRAAIKKNPEVNDINDILGDPKDKLYMQYAKSMIIFGMIKSNPSLTITEATKISLIALNKARLADVKSLITELLSQSDEQIVWEMNLNKTAPTDYELGCRGQFSTRKKLVCSYDFTSSDFLRLAPLKQEVVNLDPRIVIYHEVLYDKEIEKLKQQSDNFTAWETEAIKKRISDISGSSFPLEGAYENLSYNYKENYRMGVLLFFLNNVEQGGATIFPKFKISVFPQKGSCLFWNDGSVNGSPA
ncbi:prolyl 4-hydroxylase subunit alpha-1, partial [Drosophila eugracilis]|uniref:prolyl 4-hydroxylase subunit alpha-1 n=1 Tax=Drosophila eugracilis TaxID=29029 RepID=UPI0007E781E2